MTGQVGKYEGSDVRRRRSTHEVFSHPPFPHPHPRSRVDHVPLAASFRPQKWSERVSFQA